MGIKFDSGTGVGVVEVDVMALSALPGRVVNVIDGVRTLDHIPIW